MRACHRVCDLHHPGVEPGSRAWKAHILTVGLMVRSYGWVSTSSCTATWIADCSSKSRSGGPAETSRSEARAFRQVVPRQRLGRIENLLRLTDALIIRVLTQMNTVSSNLEGLDRRLLKCLHKQGKCNFTAIQLASWLRLGRPSIERDFLIKASTGKGKTLAYALPLFNALSAYSGARGAVVLVLLPNLELAKQVAAVCSPFASVISTCVLSQVSRCRKRLTNTYRSRLQRFAHISSALSLDMGYADFCSAGKDVVIMTPGQLRSWLTNTQLESVQVFVMDEADKLLRQSHQGWLSYMKSTTHFLRKQALQTVGQRPRTLPRTLLVSATLSTIFTEAQSVELFAADQVQEAGQESIVSLPPQLMEVYVVVEVKQRMGVLGHILCNLTNERVIVITSTVAAALRLSHDCEKLYPDLLPVKFFGVLPKMEQKHSLEAFRAGTSRLLIASDAAARGLDITGVQCVISYDTPSCMETYVHRVGRTARGCTAGCAITFCRSTDMDKLSRMLSTLKRFSMPVTYNAKQVMSDDSSLIRILNEH